jgi:hypothetical protein
MNPYSPPEAPDEPHKPDRRVAHTVWALIVIGVLMNSVKWMKFSGATPLMISESLLNYWNGYYKPIDDADDIDFPDLQLPDGRAFGVWDESDFKNPQTDQDRKCSPQRTRDHPMRNA